MRVISSDGKYDLPYEKCCVWTNKFNNVMAYPSGEPGSEFTMATYSTPEKAEKAMQLLHETYSGMPIVFQNVEIPEVEQKQLKGILDCSIIANIPNEPSKVELVNNVIFQLPKEEDL